MRLDQMPLEVQKQLLETAKTEIEFHQQFLEVWKKEIDKYETEKKAGNFYQIPFETYKERDGYFKNVPIDDVAVITDQTASLKSASGSITSHIQQIELAIVEERTKKVKSAPKTMLPGGSVLNKVWKFDRGTSVYKFDDDFGVKASDINDFLTSMERVENFVFAAPFPDDLNISEGDFNTLTNAVRIFKTRSGFPRFKTFIGITATPNSYEEGDAIISPTKGEGYISFIKSYGTLREFEISRADKTVMVPSLSYADFKNQDWTINSENAPNSYFKTEANNRRKAATGSLHTSTGWYGIETGIKKYLNFGNDIFLDYSGTADLNKFLIVPNIGSTTKKFVKRTELPSSLSITEIKLPSADITTIANFLTDHAATWAAFSKKADLYELDVGDPFKFDYSITTTYYGSILYKYTEGHTSKVVIYVKKVDTGGKVSGLVTTVAGLGVGLGTWTADSTNTIDGSTLEKYQFNLEGEINEQAKNEVTMRTELMLLKNDIPTNWEKIIELIPKITTRKTEYDTLLGSAETERKRLKDEKNADVRKKINDISNETDEANLRSLIPLYLQLESLADLGDKAALETKRQQLQAALDLLTRSPGGGTTWTCNTFAYLSGKATNEPLDQTQIDALVESVRYKVGKKNNVASPDNWAFKDIDTMKFYVPISRGSFKSTDADNLLSVVFFMKLAGNLVNATTSSTVQFRNLKNGLCDKSSAGPDKNVNDTTKSPLVKEIADPNALEFFRNHVKNNSIPCPDLTKMEGDLLAAFAPTP